ncbi:MAG: hypothetical protein HON90_15550 [Halobacteriovoraceae bacterium]|jgi:hypothetical protein|nr:hypothetical protein [Halobacteriovoraceae bacterium]
MTFNGYIFKNILVLIVLSSSVAANANASTTIGKLVISLFKKSGMSQSSAQSALKSIRTPHPVYDFDYNLVRGKYNHTFMLSDKIGMSKNAKITLQTEGVNSNRITLSIIRSHEGESFLSEKTIDKFIKSVSNKKYPRHGVDQHALSESTVVDYLSTKSTIETHFYLPSNRMDILKDLFILIEKETHKFLRLSESQINI